uniref:Uncharacterized protein n=1 Tax=Glossina pallidipes TaxID=7398 RepID=A0A1A9ZEN4_GLOPL
MVNSVKNSHQSLLRTALIYSALEVQRMARQYLEYTMTNRLKILWNLDPLMRDTEIGIELSRGVYSWSYEKFLARRRFKHVWIDLLMWEFGEALLERVKLHFDLSEVSRLLDVLFKALVDVFKAIDIRYQLNWYRSKVKQMQLKCDKLQESYLKSTSQALQASKTEEDFGYNIVNVIYNETEVPNEYCQRFQELITYFQNLYDIELEKVETGIRAKKKQITKLVDHQKFLSEEIIRFEEEIAARKALEIKRLERPTVVYQIDREIYSKYSLKRRNGNRKKSKG